jgi:hypothetical protein
VTSTRFPRNGRCTLLSVLAIEPVVHGGRRAKATPQASVRSDTPSPMPFLFIFPSDEVNFQNRC